jgi:hypothetical protein
MVIYRSKLHASLKRNFQLMPGAQWLELLCQHIPDRYEHLVRYCGWYASRSRGERAKTKKKGAALAAAYPAVAESSEFSRSAKAAWARLIRKVYEVDPLLCPRCGESMRVIALIDDPAVVKSIVPHLALRDPQFKNAEQRAPPTSAAG